jgi:hypothetical protein
MSHKFYRTASKQAGLPGRIANSSFEKIKKFAHDVWDVNDAGDDVIAVRKRQETAEIDFKAEDTRAESPFGVGELVLLFLGGSRVAARVLESNDGTLKLSTHEGELENIPQAWCRLAQTPPGGDPSRTITREDIPVVDPNQLPQQPQQQQPMQLDENQMMIADSLKKLLQSRGGKIAIRLNPSTYMTISMSPNGGVQDEVWTISTQRADSRAHQSIEALIKSRGLTNYPEEVSAESFAGGAPGRAG